MDYIHTKCGQPAEIRVSAKIKWGVCSKCGRVPLRQVVRPLPKTVKENENEIRD